MKWVVQFYRLHNVYNVILWSIQPEEGRQQRLLHFVVCIISIIKITYRPNLNSNLHISKAPLEGQAQDTNLFTSASTSQRGCIEQGKFSSVDLALFLQNKNVV